MYICTLVGPASSLSSNHIICNSWDWCGDHFCEHLKTKQCSCCDKCFPTMILSTPTSFVYQLAIISVKIMLSFRNCITNLKSSRVAQIHTIWMFPICSAEWNDTTLFIYLICHVTKCLQLQIFCLMQTVWHIANSCSNNRRCKIFRKRRRKWH